MPATATVAAFLAPVLEIAGLLLVERPAADRRLQRSNPPQARGAQFGAIRRAILCGAKDPTLRSTSPLDLWGRRWNLHVHAILKIGFYKPLVKVVPKAAASVATFVASALYHEIVFAVRSVLRLGVDAFFALQGVIRAGQLGLMWARCSRICRRR